MADITEICNHISTTSGIHPLTVRAVCKHLFREMRQTLQQQEDITIPDFGRFTFKKRKERINDDVTNPHGEKTYSPATTILHFEPDRKWKLWQRIHSAQLPDQLPPGTHLPSHLLRSSYIRQQMGMEGTTADNLNERSQSFFHNLIVERAKRKAEK